MTRTHATGATVETVRQFRDERGSAFEPMDGSALARYANVHVAITEPGCVRGNHRHRRATEVICVVGPALVRVRDGDAQFDVTVADGEVARFTFPPGVAHAVKNTGVYPTPLIAFRTAPHDRQAPDVEMVELIAPGAEGS